MAKKHIDPLKAKQKKQKIMAAVLGVLFLGLLAFQVPRVMKQLNPKAPPVAASTTTSTPSGTPSLAAPTLGGAEQPAASSGTGSLASSGVPVVQDGQLASFSRFASKDPFAQQLSDEDVSSTASSGSGGSSSGSSSSGSGSSGGIPSVTGNAPAPGSAVISINGTLYQVTVGTDFPQASTTDPTLVPLFHLLSLTAHSAKISIVGGSYASGAGAVALKENKPVTLMNTADGTRYKLVLKPQGTSLPGTGATTPPTTTVTLPPATP
jgi:hypothetical protein